MSGTVRVMPAPNGSGGGEAVVFVCPGCGNRHVCPVSGPGPLWGWNQNLARPTLTPSILVRSGHYMNSHQGPGCWCTYNAEHPDEPAPFSCGICHSFVEDGNIKFLPDCTHSLAGETVPLPELDWPIAEGATFTVAPAIRPAAAGFIGDASEAL